MNEQNESMGTIDKLRAMQAGNTVRLTRDECRILKLLDRSNEIRTRPVRAQAPLDVDAGLEWECWFEWQTLNESEIAQLTYNGGMS